MTTEQAGGEPDWDGITSAAEVDLYRGTWGPTVTFFRALPPEEINAFSEYSNEHGIEAAAKKFGGELGLPWRI